MSIFKLLEIFTGRSTNSPAAVPNAAKVGAIQPSDPQKELVATIIIRTMEIIIDAVSSDFERAKGFIEKDPVTGQLSTKQPLLPTSWADKSDWETPVIIDGKFVTEAKSEKPNVVANNSSSKSVNQIEPQVKGTFLLDFHTAFHSNDAHFNIEDDDVFNIEVKPANRALNIIELGDGRTKQLKIVWTVLNKGENRIFLKHRAIAKSSTSAALAETSDVETNHLFTFYDHEVNPRDNQKTDIDVNEIFWKAHRSLGNDYLNGIPFSLKDQIDNLSPLLLRAFYATTSQKLKNELGDQ